MSTKSVNKEKGMGFALVFAGLMFFYNPCVNLLDFLPDMFGALLIYLGLRKQACVDGYFEEARKLSFYLVFLYAAKFAFSFSVLANSDNALPYTFISSVLELIFLLVFFHKLFAGFEYTLMRSTGGMQNVRTNEPYAFSMIFVIVKCVGVVLVELFELITQGTDYDLSANAAYYASLASVKKYAVLLCIIVQVILGIIFIIQMSHFFRCVKKHPCYCREMQNKYLEDVSVNKNKHLNKTLSAAYIIMIVAMVFAADFMIDGMDFLPDAVTSLLVVLSFYVLTYAGDYVKLPKTASLLLVAAGMASTAFYSYVNPERFNILSKERSMVENHSVGFFENSNSVMITATVGFIFVAVFIYAMIKWVSCNRKIYEKELMGNHDRKLLTVSVLSCISVVIKAISATVEAASAYIATDRAVSLFLSDRPVLTEQRMAERISSDEKIALFVNLENISFVISFFAVMFVIFALFNIFALKSEVVKEEK